MNSIGRRNTPTEVLHGKTKGLGCGSDREAENALAKTIIGLYKTEAIRHQGPWRGATDVDIATLDWKRWFNHNRLLESLGNVRPVEYEDMYCQQQKQAAA